MAEQPKLLLTQEDIESLSTQHLIFAEAQDEAAEAVDQSEPDGKEKKKRYKDNARRWRVLGQYLGLVARGSK